MPLCKILCNTLKMLILLCNMMKQKNSVIRLNLFLWIWWSQVAFIKCSSYEMASMPLCKILCNTLIKTSILLCNMMKQKLQLLVQIYLYEYGKAKLSLLNAHLRYSSATWWSKNYIIDTLLQHDEVKITIARSNLFVWIW